jgi:integrase
MEKSATGKTAAYEGASGATRFQRDFAEIREAAATAAAHQSDDALAAEIRTLQFRDLRRTCVVYLGELGLEDHLIAAITGHRTLAMVALYTRTADQEKLATAAIHRLKPRSANRAKPAVRG